MLSSSSCDSLNEERPHHSGDECARTESAPVYCRIGATEEEVIEFLNNDRLTIGKGIPIVRHRHDDLKLYGYSERYVLPLMEMFMKCKTTARKYQNMMYDELPYELENIFVTVNPTLRQGSKVMHPRFQRMGAFARAAVSDDEKYIFPYWPYGTLRTSSRPIRCKTGVTERNTSILERTYLYKLATKRYAKYDDMKTIYEITHSNFLSARDSHSAEVFGFGRVSDHHQPSTLAAGRDYLVFTRVIKHDFWRVIRKVAIVDTPKCSTCDGYLQCVPTGWRIKDNIYKRCVCLLPHVHAQVSSCIESTVTYTCKDPITQNVRMTYFKRRQDAQTGRHTIVISRKFEENNLVNLGDAPSSWGWQQLESLLYFIRTGYVTPLLPRDSNMFLEHMDDRLKKLDYEDTWDRCFDRASRNY